MGPGRNLDQMARDAAQLLHSRGGAMRRCDEVARDAAEEWALLRSEGQNLFRTKERESENEEIEESEHEGQKLARARAKKRPGVPDEDSLDVDAVTFMRLVDEDED